MGDDIMRDLEERAQQAGFMQEEFGVQDSKDLTSQIVQAMSADFNANKGQSFPSLSNLIKNNPELSGKNWVYFFNIGVSANIFQSDEDMLIAIPLTQAVSGPVDTDTSSHTR